MFVHVCLYTAAAFEKVARLMFIPSCKAVAFGYHRSGFRLLTAYSLAR